MARKFFYVCAGMLMLALSYHLGATTATAQAAGSLECASYSGNAAWAVAGHHLYYLSNSAPREFVDYGPLPNATRAVACGPLGVVLEDGSVWQSSFGEWVQFGQFPLGGPVPAQQQSWGQLKARYR